MTRESVNYDAIASTYNQRFDEADRPAIARALENLARSCEARCILEVGCGTGRWLAALSNIADCCHGLDLSAGMLAQAQTHGTHIHLTRGRGGVLPFPNATFDMIYCVNAIHHFTKQHAFIREAWRLLRPGGVFATIGTYPHDRRDSWYVYDYFDGTYETDLARFPSRKTVLDWVAGAGFQQIKHQIIETIVDHKVGRTILDDLFLQKHATSQLALLSDAAYARGRHKLETDIATAEANRQTLVFQAEIKMELLSGQRPGKRH